MEVRNNTQNHASKATSFGMAFKCKDPTSFIVEASRMVERGKASRPTQNAKRGITKIVKQHANDQHFDFEYLGKDQFRLIPKTKKAQEMMDNHELPDFTDVLDSNRKLKDMPKGFRGLMFRMGQFMEPIRSKLIYQLHPEYELSDTFRSMSQTVRACEEIVNKEVAKDAKAAEKTLLDNLTHIMKNGVLYKTLGD